MTSVNGTKSSAGWRALLSRAIASAILIAIVVGGGYGLWNMTFSMGWYELEDAARANGVRTAADARTAIAEAYEMDPTLVLWCMGVVRWDRAEARGIGWLKVLAVPVMNIPCGRLYEDA